MQPDSACRDGTAQNLAATPMDSQDRFEARRLLPGMAARLRMVGQAAPIVAALSKTGNAAAGKEAAVSELYGGSGGERAVTDEVYSAIGSVRTCSHLIASMQCG